MDGPDTPVRVAAFVELLEGIRLPSTLMRFMPNPHVDRPQLDAIDEFIRRTVAILSHDSLQGPRSELSRLQVRVVELVCRLQDVIGDPKAFYREGDVHWVCGDWMNRANPLVVRKVDDLLSAIYESCNELNRWVLVEAGGPVGLGVHR